MNDVTLPKIFWIFVKVSTCTIGGGYAMIPVFEEELVNRRRWLTADDMLSTLAIAQSCPGLIAANVAVFVGIRLRGLPGALAATAGVVLTPFLSIILLAGAVMALADQPPCAAALAGVRAGVAALIALALVKLGRQALRSPAAWLLAAAAFLVVVMAKANPVWAIAGGALAGLLGLLDGPRPADGAKSQPEDAPGGK